MTNWQTLLKTPMSAHIHSQRVQLTLGEMLSVAVFGNAPDEIIDALGRAGVIIRPKRQAVFFALPEMRAAAITAPGARRVERPMYFSGIGKSSRCVAVPFSSLDWGDGFTGITRIRHAKQRDDLLSHEWHGDGQTGDDALMAVCHAARGMTGWRVCAFPCGLLCVSATVPFRAVEVCATGDVSPVFLRERIGAVPLVPDAVLRFGGVPCRVAIMQSRPHEFPGLVFGMDAARHVVAKALAMSTTTKTGKWRSVPIIETPSGELLARRRYGWNEWPLVRVSGETTDEKVARVAERIMRHLADPPFDGKRIFAKI